MARLIPPLMGINAKLMKLAVNYPLFGKLYIKWRLLRSHIACFYINTRFKALIINTSLMPKIAA